MRALKGQTAKTKNNSDLPSLSKLYDTFELQMAKSFMGNSVTVVGGILLSPFFGINILREGANEKETKKFKNFLNIMALIHKFKFAYKWCNLQKVVFDYDMTSGARLAKLFFTLRHIFSQAP